MEEVKNNIMTDEELDKLVEAASESVNPDAIDIRNIDVEANPDAELDIGIAKDDALSSEVINKYHDADISLFDIKSGEELEPSERDINSVTDMVKGDFDLSDEEVLQMADIFKNIKRKDYKIYPNLPDKLKNIVTCLIMENKADPRMAESISRTLIEELMRESGIDNALIDLEKAIDEALNIPSITDMYSEHTKNVMETIIPETIEKIKDEYPDKAERLQAVRDTFYQSYTFDVCIKEYSNNSRLRKAVRRFDLEYDRTLDRFNHMNEKSSFKMNDVRLVPEALHKVLIDDINIQKEIGEFSTLDYNIYELGITEVDIKKFCIMVLKYCDNMDPMDLIQSTFMYYLTRNITMLKHSNEAKTDFAVELINNICAVIAFIRNEEAKFNESNMDKSKPTKKRINTSGIKK